MKIYIKYYRQFTFTNYSTIAFDIDPECLVIDLKKMIFARLRVEIKVQILKINMYGKMEQMNDDCSLSFYDVKQGSYIYLENVNEEQTESQVSTNYNLNTDKQI